MNSKSILLAGVIALMFFAACSKSKEEKAFEVFNEGVTLSLQADAQMQAGNVKQGLALNARAIEKYKETLAIDSTHGTARSTLGHSYYMQKDYEEGIRWFEQANALDTPMAVNYREMGLCKINLGRIPEAIQDFDKAFKMDGGKEIRDITIEDLTDIGHLAFQYGEAYKEEGDTAKSTSYKRFSIGVLITAFTIDTTKKDIAEAIAQYADKIGEKATAERYRELAQ